MSLYQNHVFVCLNRRPEGHSRGCCASKGAEAIRNHLKLRAKELGLPATRINGAQCLDQCEHGPAIVVYPDGIWYRCPDVAAAERILTEHLRDGRPVADLQLETTP